MTTTTSKPNGTAFKDLFKPLGETSTPAANPENTASNSATAPTPDKPGSTAAANGTVSQADAFSALNHTQISSAAVPGLPGSVGTTPGAPGQSVALGGMVKGEWAVDMIDAVLPAAIVAGFYALGIKLRKSEVQASQGEKNTLIPIVQKCMDTVMLNFDNPWNALIVTLGIIYGGKAAEKGVVAYIDKNNAKKEQEALQAKAKAMQQADPQNDISNQSAMDIQEAISDEPTEAEIEAAKKKWKYTREKTIERLKKRKK